MSEPIIHYYSDGNIWEKLWTDENYYFHNENGPAYILYFPNGKIAIERWYINGKLHRINGPCNIYYNGKNKIDDMGWFYNGNCYSLSANDWLKENNKNWKKMTYCDYNRMWFEII